MKSFIAKALLGFALAPCAHAVSDGQHDFDDSFGNWKVHISRMAHPLSHGAQQVWLEYEGIHRIVPIWDGRGNVATLVASGPAGTIEAMSPRLYNPATKQWSVRYASSRDGSMDAPLVGQFADGRGVFFGQDTVNGKAVLVRNIYSARNKMQHQFEIAYSENGGSNWETVWIMTETRQPETK